VRVKAITNLLKGRGIAASCLRTTSSVSLFPDWEIERSYV
jgi:hypothetical protein